MFQADKVRFLLWVTVVSLLLYVGKSYSQSALGALPYTPSRIEWLGLSLRAGLRQSLTENNKFLLDIAVPDHQTILIYVRYLPNVNREVMNISIQSAREVTMIRAKGYGWDKWVKIREDVQQAR